MSSRVAASKRLTQAVPLRGAAALLLLNFVATNCSSPDEPSALISLGSGAVDFSAVQGGSNPPSRTISVSNSGGGSLDGISVSSPAYGPGQPTGWLSATVSPSALTLAASVSGVPAGSYGATIQISAPSASNGPLAVSVTFVVTLPPLIALQPGTVQFTAEQGGLDPQPVVITVGNGGGGTLSGLAVSGVGYTGQSGWLGTPQLSGATAGSSLTIRPATGALPVGTYSASVSITSTTAANSPQMLPVGFTVTAPVPATLSVETQPAGAVSGQVLTTKPAARLRGSNNQLVAQAGITVTAEKASGSGTLGGTLTAVTDAQGIAAFASLSVSGQGDHALRFTAQGLTAATSATFNVAPPPLIALQPATLTFTAEQRGPNPAAQAVTISNGGGGALTGITVLGVSSGGQAVSWLAAPQLSGSDADATLTIQPVTGSLPIGSHSAEVSIGANAGNAPQVLPVTFDVVAPVAASLAVTTEPAGAVSAQPLATQPVVRLRGSNGQAVQQAGVIVTASVASGAGTLGGTTTAPSDPQGVAAFTDLSITGTGAHALRFAAPSLSGTTSASFTVDAAPVIQLAQSAVSFAGTAGGADPAAQTVAITNGGGGTLSALAVGVVSYGSGQPAGWLGQPGLDQSAAPAVLTLRPVTGPLASGTYTATVPVTSSIPGVAAASVTVSFVVSAAPVQPAIALSATSFTFTATAGGGNPPAQTLTITNGGGGTLSGIAVGAIGYGSGEPTGWLPMPTPSSGTAPAALQLAPVTGSLAPGTYTGTVSLTASASNSPQAVTVTFTVTAPSPLISLSPASLGFSAVAGQGNPAARTVDVTNAGGGSLAGLAVDSVRYGSGQTAGWLGAPTLSAVTAPATLTVQPVTGGLSAGTYTATFWIGGSGAGNTPQPLAVTFTVEPSPVISPATGTVSFSAQQGGSGPAPQGVAITNGGGGTLSGLAVGTVTYGMGEPTGWLTASVGGTAPTSLSLQVTVGTLTAGSYSATVPVTSSLPGVATANVTVTFTVAPPPPPSIALSSAALSFGAFVQHYDPPSQNVTITNGGAGTLSGLTVGPVSYGSGSNWLMVLFSGTTAPMTVSLYPSISGLATGTYTATVPIASSLPNVASQAITVTLVISQTPVLAISPAPVQLVATAGGSDPAPVAAAVTAANGPATGLSVTAISYGQQPSGWLTAGLSATTTPASLTLSAATGSLAPGLYSATLAVQSAASGNLVTSAGLQVYLTVAAPVIAPVIALSPAAVTVGATAGAGNPAPQAVAVTNGGDGSLTGLGAGAPVYGQGQPTGWLAATLNQNAAPATLTLQATTGSLQAGTYTATVPVTSSLPGVAAQSATMSFVVSASAVPPAIATSPAALAFSTTFTASNNGQSPAPGQVTIANSGGGTLSGLAVGTIEYVGGPPAYDWITSATLGSSTAPATLTVQVERSFLDVGTYQATVPITSSLPGVSPVNVTVTFTVSDPAISVTPTQTSLPRVTVGSTTPVTSPPVAVGNAGTGAATGLFLGTLPAWLTGSLSSATAPATLTFVGNPSGLPFGAYQHDVEVSSPDVFASASVRVYFSVDGFTLASLNATLTSDVGGAAAETTIGMTRAGVNPAVSQVTYAAGQPAGWLQAEVQPQFNATQLWLYATPGLLPAGTYTASVEVVGGSITRTVVVTFVVQPSAQPVAGFSRTFVLFPVAPVGMNPAPEALQVTNLGGQPLTGLYIQQIVYTLGAGGWLQAVFDQTTAPATLTLTAARGSLAPGEYWATVYVSSAGDLAGGVIGVKFWVPVAPAILLSPSRTTFGSGSAGQDPPSQVVSVLQSLSTTLPQAPLTGLAIGTITYSANGSGWLAAVLSQTTAPAVLRLQPYTAGLAEGTYTALVPVSSPVASNSPRVDTVTLTIAPPAIALSPTTVNLVSRQGGSGAGAPVSVTNAGGAPLTGLSSAITYQGGFGGWLSAGLISTSAPTTLVVSATTGSLTVNTYQATVRVSSSLPNVVPQDATVVFTVRRTSYATDLAGLVSSACAFCHQPGGQAPDLRASSAYSSLTTGTRYVVAGDTLAGLLLPKIKPGGSMSQYSSITLTDLIRDWILQGAHP